MSIPIPSIINLIIFAVILLFLYWMQRKYFSFSNRVFSGLALGVLFGIGMHLIYKNGEITSPENANILKSTIQYMDVIGVGYVRLLQMIIMPLIMVSLISAIINLKDNSSMGKTSAISIGVLVITTVIAAFIGVVVAQLFGLTGEGLISNELSAGTNELKRIEYLQNTQATMGEFSLPKMLLEFIPSNPFLDMTGARKTSTIAIVIFSVLIGIAAMGVAKKQQELFLSFEHFINVARAIVMRLVTIVLRLTPYGVAALMAKMVTTSEVTDILTLITFVVASYVALIAMFFVHLMIVSGLGLSPIQFAKKIFPVLVFAFTSRSSAASIPFNIQTQTKALGISESVANFSASFGATIGQNGCGGIYPAMLAFMIAPTVGIDPWSVHFILSLLVIIAVGSFGVAGVGGGATFAALIVLSALDFPIELVGLLISVEPLIDMGRTALNVSGSITAGTVTARFLNEINTEQFNDKSPMQFDSDSSIEEFK